MLIIETYSKLKKNTWNGFNLLSSSLNTVGINILNVFSGFSNKDFLNSTGLFFFNSSLNEISNLNKMLNLKLLNYLAIQVEYFIIKLGCCSKKLLLSKISEYLYLPSSNFFENSGETTSLSRVPRPGLISFFKKIFDHKQI